MCLDLLESVIDHEEIIRDKKYLSFYFFILFCVFHHTARSKLFFKSSEHNRESLIQIKDPPI